jgi:hypothetical protein
MAVAMVVASPLAAQVQLDLLIEPWSDRPRIAETNDEPVYILEGEDSISGQNIQIFDWDSYGRIKFDKNEREPGLWLGYRLRTIEINSDIDDFPTGLTDLALAAAVPLSDEDSEWSIGMIGGAGIATNNHFGDSDAIYGIGVLDFQKHLDDDRHLHLGIDYHGNRALWPDIPLPYAMFSHQVSPDLSYRAGLPHSGLAWNASETISFEFDYTFPINLSGLANWKLTDEFSLFADYHHTIDGFWRDDEPDTQRLFYEYDRVGVGVHWTRGRWIDLSLGVGYAFSQEFSRGFDMRDLDEVASPSDELVISLAIRGTF